MRAREHACLYNRDTMTYLYAHDASLCVGHEQGVHTYVGRLKADALRDGQSEPGNKTAGYCGFSLLRLVLDRSQNKRENNSK